MQRRYNLAHFILASVVVLVLTLLMACVDAQARIAFSSGRDGNSDIYVIDTNGGNLQNLTNHPRSDSGPAWFNSPLSVSTAGKKFTMWGRLKQADR